MDWTAYKEWLPSSHWDVGGNWIGLNQAGNKKISIAKKMMVCGVIEVNADKAML